MFGKNRRKAKARAADITADIRARGVRIPSDWRVYAPATEDGHGEIIAEGHAPIYTFPKAVHTWQN